MRLFSFEAKGGPKLGVPANGPGGAEGFADLTEAFAKRGVGARDGLLELIQAPEEDREGCLELAREALGGSGGFPFVPAAEARILAPVRRPGKIVCVGRNYREHCSEQNEPAPERPLLFAKWPQTVIGPGEAVERPSFVQKMDYEVELVAVIGRSAKNVSRADALGHVFGYSVANDISARGLQKLDKQWLRAKSCDTFCPLGPCVLVAEASTDPQAMRARSWVDGQPRQDASTADMIFPVAELVEFISAAFRLEPGDLVLTGTPPGVGAYREPPEFLEPGQSVRVGIEGIGEFENPVEQAPGVCARAAAPGLLR